jgi:opacity protein-like surface antigen
MNRCSIVAVGISVMLAASGSPLAAQRPARLGVFGGVTYPRGSDFSDVAKRGWNAGALISLGAPPFPLSFRIDGQWHQMDGKTIDVADVGSHRTDYRIIDGTAGFEWTLGKPAASNLYLIAGAGVYKLRGKTSLTGGNALGSTSDTETAEATKFGWNFGAGLRFTLAGHGLFIEARYHNVHSGHEVDATGGSKSLNFIPIEAGITL